jgi:hypothetical protein
MYAAIIDDVYLENLGTAKFKNARKAFAERVVSEMAEMKRFVRVRARELNHDALAS